MGHAFTFSLLDVFARKKRMEGFNVLHPMGWDAFGLPTENYAIRTGIHPEVVTEKNTKRFHQQMDRLGLAYSWKREINTTDPEYYRWTQWIFVQLFKNGLAYKAETPVGWCPECKIILANEEIVEGKCERCGAQAERRMQKQWLLRITAYADRLVDDLDLVDYPAAVKISQRNWIGRSEGTRIKFKVQSAKLKVREIEVFTTRVDTIFGVTAVVVAPEHPLVGEILKNTSVKKIKDYVEKSKKKSELERTELTKEKTGVFTGLYCINPVNNESIPIWVGDYVVGSYGGGAVMVVPAHDQRDFEFAKKYNLPIKRVIAKSTKDTSDVGFDSSEVKEAFIDYGILINSAQFSGLTSQEAIKKITRWLTAKKLGKKSVAYKLRDWIFSRQHYWGEPIPMIYCSKCAQKGITWWDTKMVHLRGGTGRQPRELKELAGWFPVAEKDLPVELPEVEKYQPTDTGESPLAKIKDWVEVKCPQCGAVARRETDTMPNWAGSSWYFLRYCDPKNKTCLADFKKLQYWMPVDLYLGGAEHTTLHLLYSRFWHKFLYDLGVVPGKEPYLCRRQHGIILGEDGEKMSKSRGNVINPDDVVKKFGADTLRLYLLFMGPYDQTMPWSTKGVEGCWRFLNRVWRIAQEYISDGSRLKVETSTESHDFSEVNGLERLRHQTIKKVTEDIESLKYNTAIAAIMEYVNELSKSKLPITNYQLQTLVLLLAPFVPHLAEEIWQQLKNTLDGGRLKRSKDYDSSEAEKNRWSVHQQPWPKYDPRLVREEIVTIVVQVNGKVRGQVRVQSAKRKAQSEIEKLATQEGNVKKYLQGKKIKKVVFVPAKIINFVLD